MTLDGFAEAAIDWAATPATEVPGESGAARVRARQLGAAQLRLVDYGPGYCADHWCAKGHLIYVVAGSLVIEHEQSAAAHELEAGMSWAAPDGATPAHRVRSEAGATVFIVD
ncbi:hypothetical protein SAMN06265365_1563 [Tistlia consotensis]|uniref:Cupin domain-containing protein n=1 Tax=Tistlia consotensis USBA 355 TaxID=560819 RepID=A0A1Y6CY63_9PROT|nr:DHCW motif cupin fold protein [Tistlia consotensis]SMF84590.1 hypothetical protein SAMN05428998_1573 [Tistlia consotensis USBA 355]SNS37199.1 hypothetical protein SAMN06265365_1563 [Tistlia consotensis]